MAERTAIEVTVDDTGEVTVHLHELSEHVRKAALTAVARALGAAVDGIDGPADGEWRRAWDAELAQRIERIEAGTAKWISLDDARQRLRGAAERAR